MHIPHFLFVCLRVLLHINPSMLSGERSRPDTSHTSSPKLLPLNPEDQARQGLTVHKESITTQQMVFTGLNFEGQIIRAHTWALHPSLWCISVCLTSLMPLIQSNSLKIFMDLDMSAQTLQNTESLSLICLTARELNASLWNDSTVLFFPDLHRCRNRY